MQMSLNSLFFSHQAVTPFFIKGRGVNKVNHDVGSVALTEKLTLSRAQYEYVCNQPLHRISLAFSLVAVS